MKVYILWEGDRLLDIYQTEGLANQEYKRKYTQWAKANNCFHSNGEPVTGAYWIEEHEVKQ